MLRSLLVLLLNDVVERAWGGRGEGPEDLRVLCEDLWVACMGAGVRGGEATI